MSRNGHIQVFVVATIVWAVFWLLGLPSYYRQYSDTTMLAVCLVLLPAVAGVAYLLLRRLAPERRVAHGSWLAFYFTIPLALYDWLYCGLYLGYGVSFLRVFWYLTVFYVVPWIVLPGSALLLNRTERRVNAGV